MTLRTLWYSLIDHSLLSNLNNSLQQFSGYNLYNWKWNWRVPWEKYMADNLSSEKDFCPQFSFNLRPQKPDRSLVTELLVSLEGLL